MVPRALARTHAHARVRTRTQLTSPGLTERSLIEFEAELELVNGCNAGAMSSPPVFARPGSREPAAKQQRIQPEPATAAAGGSIPLSGALQIPPAVAAGGRAKSMVTLPVRQRHGAG